ncbi:ferredoxin--NADP reductase [Betaproteobacteria bacterium]|nr:ferredoxin--NADP reductase [Betaproteobacteria bacterium]
MVQINNVTVVSVKCPAENIFRIEIGRPDGFIFKPGQFARIGINPNNGGCDKIWRAQTIVSRAIDKTLAFYIVHLEGKPFSDTLKKIKTGDEVYLDALPYGHFTLDRFGPGGDLWLFSTGTGVAPYLCMLQQERIWENFSSITLVCSFRDQTQFVYRDSLPLDNEKLTAFQNKNYKKFSFIPIYTREKTASDCIVKGMKITNTFSMGYFKTLISNGELTFILENSISTSNSKIMLSGNPTMIKTTRDFLKTLGLRSSRRNNPGHIAVENYW